MEPEVITEVITETLPQLDFNMFMNVHPAIFIVSICMLIFTISVGSEAIVFMFIKILDICETAFNELNVNERYELKGKFKL